jgi:hypothetical protein
MHNPRSSLVVLTVVLNLGLFATGCDRLTGKKELPPGASAENEVGRPLGDLELPVSLRNSDTAPGDARTVEATTEQLRIDGAPVIALDNGKVKDADVSDGTIPKLASTLSSPARSTIALRLQANIPYDTMALVLNTAAKAGMHNAAIQVRGTGESTKLGWLVVDNFVMTARADDIPDFGAVKPHGWNDFTEKWQEIHDACRTSSSGNCAYVNENFASGGTLKIELLASGRGLNVNFFRRGLTDAQQRDEYEKRAKYVASKKEDYLQGRLSHDDLVEILLLGEPSEYALFQFRYQEALKKGQTAIGATIAPLCSKTRCGIVLSSDRFTPVVRMTTLIGAAFPDGTSAPAFAFEMPWTPRPKYVKPEWMKDDDTSTGI